MAKQKKTPTGMKKKAPEEDRQGSDGFQETPTKQPRAKKQKVAKEEKVDDEDKAEKESD